MDSLAYVDRKRAPALPRPLGTLVFCIHCIQTLGKVTAVTTREVLIARHTCAESELAKQPATPPPYS
jgi:hypothetical protein